MNEKDLICTMTGQQYRAASVVIPKNDVRFYLNGIFVSLDNTEVAATNGHIMYAAGIKAGPAMEDVIFEPVPIIKSVAEVDVYLHDEGSVMVVGYKHTRLGDRITDPVVQTVCRRVDGRYPDYRAVMDPKKEPSLAYTEFGFNAAYLALLPKIFGDVPVRVSLPNPNMSARITSAKPEHGTVVLMPCRL